MQETGATPDAEDTTPPRGGAAGLVSLDEIYAAAVRIRGVASRTPVVAADLDGREVLLKCESLQAGGAFKVRGAYNMLVQLSDKVRRRGVITYSSGNHGQALALAAARLGCPAVVVMPTTAPRIKVEGTRARGAEVILEGTTLLERRARAEREAEDRGLTIVPPFEHPWIIAGQGTIGLEILDEVRDVAAVIVPVGGGGLLAGVGAAIKQSRPSVRVIGVEPSGAAKMRASLDAGRPVTLASSASLADGLLALRPGELTFAHARAFADEVVGVGEGAIADAVVWLARTAKLLVEPSGAVPIAALRGGAAADITGPIVAVLSGGNIAPELLAELLGRG